MKTHIRKFIGLFFLATIVLVGCEDKDNLDIIEPEAAFTLEQSTSPNIILNYGLPDNPAFMLAWTDEVTGSSSYEIEMDLDDTFPSPISLGNSVTNTFSISVMDLNSAINASGVDSFDALTLYVRVLAGSTASNAVVYTVTAYTENGVLVLSPENGEEFVLSIGSSDEDILDLVWTDPLPEAYGSVDYSIEAALSGTDFAAPVNIGGGTDISEITLTHSALNAIALGIGLAPEEPGNVDLRVKATTINSNGTVLERIGDEVTISVTPYSVSFPFLYLVGSATTPGWNNNNNNTIVFRNQDVPNNYVYSGYFNAGEFKLLEVLGQWQPQWGTNDGSTLAVNPGGGPDPGTFVVATAGYYTYNFTVVDEGGSFTVTPFDASSAPTYGTMGLIGSATPNGWDGNNDTNFTQDTNNPHLWYINDVTLTEGGEFLIRANDVWDGPDSAVWRYTGSQELYGEASFDGSNFPFNGSTGSYDIWFNDLDGKYVLVPN
jgi:hypothetical protein